MQVIISYLFQWGIKIKLLGCTSLSKNKKLWLIILAVWDCCVTHDAGRRPFEIQSLRNVAVYCIHVVSLTGNDDAFLAWSYWLSVFEITDTALIPVW